MFLNTVYTFKQALTSKEPMASFLLKVRFDLTTPTVEEFNNGDQSFMLQHHQTHKERNKGRLSNKDRTVRKIIIIPALQLLHRFNTTKVA